MLIRTTTRVAKVNIDKVKPVQDLVRHKHHIAWQPSIDKKVSLQGKKVDFCAQQLPSFYTFTIDKDKQSKTLHDYLLLGQQSAQYLGKIFPETMNKPIDAMTLLVDSSEAFQTWTDPMSEKTQTALATGKAVLSAFDVFEPYLPILQQYNAYTKVAGVLLNVAESVYLVQKEYEFTSAT